MTLVRACGLADETSALVGADSLLHELARRVEYLLRHDSEKLKFYLYSLDVSEDEVAKAFEPDSAEEPALRIARAILDREAQRLRTRKRYEQERERGDPRLGVPQIESKTNFESTE